MHRYKSTQMQFIQLHRRQDSARVHSLMIRYCTVFCVLWSVCVLTYRSCYGQAASGPFPATYSDDFDSAAPESLAKFWADQCGSFQVMPASGGRDGHILMQRADAVPGVNQWAVSQSLVHHASFTADCAVVRCSTTCRTRLPFLVTQIRRQTCMRRR